MQHDANKTLLAGDGRIAFTEQLIQVGVPTALNRVAVLWPEELTLFLNQPFGVLYL